MIIWEFQIITQLFTEKLSFTSWWIFSAGVRVFVFYFFLNRWGFTHEKFKKHFIVNELKWNHTSEKEIIIRKDTT